MTQPDIAELHVKVSDGIAEEMNQLRYQRDMTPNETGSLHDIVVTIELLAFANQQASAAAKSRGRTANKSGIVHYNEARRAVKVQLDSRPQSAHFVPRGSDYGTHFDSAWNRLSQLVGA